MARLIGISDIHGEYDKLCAVIDKISPQKNDNGSSPSNSNIILVVNC